MSARRAMWCLTFVFIGCGPDAGARWTDDDTAVVDDAIKSENRATAFPEAVTIDFSFRGAFKGTCSGSLLSDTVVLTAAHCVRGADTWLVYAPYAGQRMSLSRSSATFDYEGSAVTGHDVGLVFLTSRIAASRFASVASGPLTASTPVVSIGRVHNGAVSNTQLYVSASTSVSTLGAFNYVGSDVIERGDSGGPLIQVGTHQVFAVNAGFSGVGGSRVSVYARTDLLSAWLKEQLASHR